MRTTLDLPDPLFRQLKAESALRGLKLKDLVAELLQAGLQRPLAVPTARARSPLPKIRKATGTTHPSLSNQEIASILTAEDVHARP
jgi:hypothetical protein